MDSITVSISPSKIKDYITAHQMILHSAEESFLRDYPEYSSIDDAREQNPDIHNYLNTIIQKAATDYAEPVLYSILVLRFKHNSVTCG